MSAKQSHTTNNKGDLLNFAELVRAMPEGQHVWEWRLVTKQRTITQNAAVHKYCELLAEALNDAGWSFWVVMNRRAFQIIKDLRNEASNYSAEFESGALETCRLIEGALTKAEVSWSMLTVKEHIWKPVQLALLGKGSTADADTSEYSNVWREVNRITTDTFGVSIPFPSRGNR